VYEVEADSQFCVCRRCLLYSTVLLHPIRDSLAVFTILLPLNAPSALALTQHRPAN